LNVGMADDDNDGLADEDGATWGDQECYAAYQDNIQLSYVSNPDRTGHTPLNIEVLQRTYAWPESIAQNVIIVDYVIRNTGVVPLDDVYVAFFADPDIIAAGEIGSAGFADDKDYFDRLRMMMVQYDNPNDADGWGPGVLGVRLLRTPVPLSSLHVSFANYSLMVGGDPPDDASKYAIMSSGLVSPASQYLDDWRMLMAFGDSARHGFHLLPGGELLVTLALICAADTVDVHLQADHALYMYEHPWEWLTVVSRLGYPELIRPGPTDWGYRLHHVSGAVGRLVFTNFCSGTTGRVSGPAAQDWLMMANGDGNDGDSIIFIASVPLTSGTIDTFWLSHPYCAAQVRWTAGDSSGFVDGPLPVELLGFNAASVSGGIELQWCTASETDNDFFEILRGTLSSGAFNRIATLPSQGNSATGHHYEYLDRAVTAGRTYWYYLADVDLSGNRTEHRELMRSATMNGAAELPSDYALSCYPNPFNPSTTISFALPEAGLVKIAVYDVSGRWIQTLVNEERNAGNHSVTFDARNLPSGVYFARLEAGAFTMTRKMLLIR
jgi:hypothetical protein